MKADGQIKVITDLGEGLSEMRDAVLLETAQKIADERDELRRAINMLVEEIEHTQLLDKSIGREPYTYSTDHAKQLLASITEEREKDFLTWDELVDIVEEDEVSDCDGSGQFC